jgi:hypothetical protein
MPPLRVLPRAGKSVGTLLDDVGPWSDAQLLADKGVDLAALRRGEKDWWGIAPRP